jgi:hypothetical protein
MAISVTCRCRRRFLVPDPIGGQRIPCPFCAEEVEVPVRSAREPEQEVKVPRRRARSGRSRRASRASAPINALGIVSALFGIAGALLYGRAVADRGAALAFMGAVCALAGLCWAVAVFRSALTGPAIGFLFCATIAILALTVPRAGPPEGSSANPPRAVQTPPRAAETTTNRQGDFLVEVVSARVGHPRVRDLYSRRVFDWKSPALIVAIEVHNLATTRVAEYRSAPCHLKDNFGNIYHEVNLGSTSLVERVAGTRPLNPGKSVSDLLVFDPPLDTAESIYLELSGDMVGLSLPFRCPIPTSQFKGSDGSSVAQRSGP